MNHSKLLLFKSLFHKFKTSVVIIGKVMLLVFLKYSLHNIEQLLLSRIVNLLQLALYLMKPVLNRI